ncbi:MAG: hypothetical protein ACLGSD_19225 [Acidobacteriota bacterium]
MRLAIPTVFILCSLWPACLAQTASSVNAPLPDPHELLQRALANEKKLAVEQERYECRVTTQTIQTDKNGKVKKDETEVDDQFYVNGMEIDRTLSKNGKELTGDGARKEDERVMKKTVKYSDKAYADKQQAKQDQQVEDFMAAMQLENGHREIVNGRSVLFYDIVPNPHFDAKNLNQKFATAMQGKIAVDEKTGEMIDLNIKSVRDIKIGGGLLANLHKGFWLHVHQSAHPDGVWLTDLAEGSGDARAMLFIHPYFRFKSTTDGCHLYTTNAQQVGGATVVK